MNDTILYPIGDMSATSKSLTSFLGDQWNQHSALFMNNHDSYSALLQAVANVIPESGGKPQELAANIQNYHKQYENCYNALHTLAELIDQAAQQMEQTDHDVARGFQ